MNLIEALKVLADGEKIRPSGDEYEECCFFIGSDEFLYSESGFVCKELPIYKEWEIYKEPKKTVVIQKWLYKYEFAKFIIEVEDIDNYIKEFGGVAVKLIETYKITI